MKFVLLNISRYFKYSKEMNCENWEQKRLKFNEENFHKATFVRKKVCSHICEQIWRKH